MFHKDSAIAVRKVNFFMAYLKQKQPAFQDNFSPWGRHLESREIKADNQKMKGGLRGTVVNVP